jgi:predicted CoA-substrate-specific enzyme activase
LIWEDLLTEIESAEKMGMDIGSRSTKAALMVNGEIHLSEIDSSRFMEIRDSICPEGISLVTTGYGRHVLGNVPTIPEIRAHVLGVVREIGLDTFTLLDIGGQDYKVIRVEGKGIRDFMMNDKCAAGTGRFLEKMADMLSIGIDELGSRKGERKILESTCSVFTETEIISLMMEGWSRDDLASGVIYSVFERIRPYLRGFPRDNLIFTGGVSRCSGLADTISEQLDVEVVIPDNPQFTGAVGCLISKRRGSHSQIYY